MGKVQKAGLSRLERARARLEELLVRERELWSLGKVRVAGVDEAGAGPLAGPVVAAAVILPPECGIEGVDDSKRLTPARRRELAAKIRRAAICWGLGVLGPREIDRLNIYRASLEAMRRAVVALAEPPDHVLVDARTVPGIAAPQEAIIRGDATCHVIAAASILAKSERDAMMEEYDRRYPGYGFASHKGYASAAHRDAIRRLGPCPIHRRSFTLLPPPGLFGDRN